MGQSIQFGDWKRLLFGDTPPVFLAETLLRTAVIFLSLLVAMRVFGKRMNGQLTITELAVMLTLGAIVGSGAQIPDPGILQAGVVLLAAVVFQRGLTWLDSKSAKVERITQGGAALLVKDGLLQLPAMAEARVSRAQLFATLRNRKILKLSDVDRVYLEACGIFSVFENHDGDRPGLSLLPGGDDEGRGVQAAVRGDPCACRHCGCTAEKSSPDRLCPNCGHQEWEKAVL